MSIVNCAGVFKERTMQNLCFILLLLLTVIGSIQNGTVKEVTRNCGSDTSATAMVNMVTDGNASVAVRCAGDRVFNFSTTDNINYQLPLFYPGNDHDTVENCVFVKSEVEEVYTIVATIMFGDPRNMLDEDFLVWILTCALGNTSLVAPNDIQETPDNITSSNLTLILSSINENDSVSLGHEVRLYGTTDGLSGEKGFRITECDAVGEEGSRYQILKEGCGDGDVLRKNKGFISRGLQAVGPPFKLFGLDSEKSVTFECNFTLCKENCDGNSCPTERTRRDTDGGQDPIFRVAFSNSSLNNHVNLTLTTVGGFPLKKTELLSRGRKYRLRMTTDGSMGEQGLQIKFCKFIGNKRRERPFEKSLIVDGCGTKGRSIFKESQGFNTTGRTATSDVFRGFSFLGDRNITFMCNATLCMENCDGHPCLALQARKRSGLDGNVIFSRIVKTTPVQLAQNHPENHTENLNSSYTTL